MAEHSPGEIDPEARRLVDAACDVWMRRLIDPSRANSLLFYRELKVGTLDLSAQNEVVDRLLAGTALPVESLIPPNAEIPEKVRNTLVALQRKALGNLEEKGLDTLHLALGMATWPASDGGRPYEAPVVLVPARIETRGQAGDDLRLAVKGEPQLNPVLLYVLQDAHDIRLEASSVLSACGGEDESGQWRIDREGVFVRIEGAASTVSGFRVKRRIVLANFQFAKMAMVEDLKKNRDTIAASDIVAAVAGHSPSRQRLAQAVVDLEPRELDARPPGEDYLVLDADSTQHRAIVLVGTRQNGVVQGPPGTGKSQTIANVIAQSVADGRRVLFVAEKRAALESVIKRLSHPSVGLGHIILDLHGASVSRREVMARVAHAFDEIRHATPVDDGEGLHREFEARRRQLNEHARRVNVARPPTGRSVSWMIGTLFRLPRSGRSDLRLRGDSLASMTAERADEAKRWIVEGAANPRLLLGTDPSPWNNANLTDGHQAQAAIDLARRAAGTWPEFERTVAQVAHELDAPQPRCLDDVATVLAVLGDVARIREQYSVEIFSADPETLARALEPAAHGTLSHAWAFLSRPAFRAARRRLLALRVTPAAPAALREEALEAANVLRRWSALGAVSAVPVSAASEKELQAAFAAMADMTKTLASLCAQAEVPFNTMPLATLADRVQALAADTRTPYLMPAVHAVRARFKSAGLDSFLDDLRAHSVPAESWTARFSYVWLSSALEQALASDSSLAAFNGRTHEQIVEAFARLDLERVRFAAQRVRRLHAERAIAAMNEHFDQADLVRREARKKSRHVPLRDLLSRAPDVLTRIAPCWVASPLSVSQLLDGGKRHFDLVIFDEASQVLQEEAIPALYRAEQVVVAGDRHQLPPTTFFATAVEGEDDTAESGDEARDARVVATAAIGGFESLLDTLDAFLPNWFLEWHYRSEDERLITFSNTHVYAGQLVTFPSARDHEAIRHILVPHDPAIGGQEESASREVDEVVRQVLVHAATRSDESLGVITMGIRHANRVQAALDRALESRAELSAFFALDREERFFVKNLETVQGDERDAIILSIGYGKTANGDVPHRFGPLTQDIGYRRLNVAVTRARRRMCVISSFSHNEIDLNRSGSRGVQLLKAYLEYAASGGRRLPEGERAGEVPLNPFEADVRDALEARGIKTRPQYGASRYRLDLVGMHPTKPGRPVLAIECDGAGYHSSATARDRDRLRQAHLQRLGWRLHRVWSTDWFYRREEEIERAREAYENAVRLADLADAEAADTMSPPGEERPLVTSADSEARVLRQRAPRLMVPIRESIDQYSDGELRQIAEWIASDGLLRTDEELIRDVFELLPFERLGSRIRERLTDVARSVRRRDR